MIMKEAFTSAVKSARSCHVSFTSWETKLQNKKWLE